MKIAEYKFDSSIDTLPSFNSEFEYTYTDINNGDGTITRTIESDTLPAGTDFKNKTGLISLEYLDSDFYWGSTYSMFLNCSNLTSVNVSNWDISTISSMATMFQNCSSLKYIIGINNLNTSSVTNIDAMFYGCSSLTELDVSNWDVSNVTSINSLFYGCSSLTELDLNDWDVSNVTGMAYLFQSCSSLKSLNLSDWNTSKTTTMNQMFQNCSLLESVDLSNWDTSNVVTMRSMFENCMELVNLSIHKWNTSNVTDIHGVFSNCKKLENVDVSEWDISKVTSLNYIFNGCGNLKIIDVSKWDTSKVTTMSLTFSNCKSITELNLNNWDVSKVTNTHYTFNSCYALKNLDLSNWDVSKVTNMQNMFNYCMELVLLDLSNFNINDTANITNMFNGVTKLSHIGMLYCNKKTVEKIQSVLPNVDSLQRTIWIQDTNEKDYASSEYVVVKEYGFEKQKVRLSQPLRGIQGAANYGVDLDCNKYYADRLYWDSAKRKYCIEQNIIKITGEDLANEVYGGLVTSYNEAYVQDFQNGAKIDFWVRNEDIFYSADILGVYNNLFPIEFSYDTIGTDKEAVFTRYDYQLAIRIAPSKLNLDYSTSPGYSAAIDAGKEWLRNSGLVLYAIRKPNIIETDITEKIALNTYNPYMKISTNEEQIEPSNIIARFPYKDCFDNDVTIDNIFTGEVNNYYGGMEYQIDMNLNRGDYFEAEFNTEGAVAYQAITALEDGDSEAAYIISYLDQSLHIAVIYNDEFIEAEAPLDEQIAKVKIDKSGIYVNDNMVSFTSNLENMKDLMLTKNTFKITVIADTYFNYIRVIKQNSDGDQYGNLSDCKHYYQTYTTYPLEIENNDLCETHDSYITEISGQTLKEVTDLTISTNLEDCIGIPFTVCARYQAQMFRNIPANVNDIIYFRINFTLNTYNVPDEIEGMTRGGVYSTRYGGGYNVHNYVLKKSDIGKDITVSVRRVIDEGYDGGIEFNLGLLAELPEGFSWGEEVFTVTLNNYVCYNLTQIFGSGEEPSEEWCDENLPYIGLNEIVSFNENNNKIELKISNYTVKFGGDK